MSKRSLKVYDMEKISNYQKVMMIRFMKNNQDLFNSKCSKAIHKKKWQILSTLLNLERNGVQNKLEEWEKIWMDWNKDVKTKIRNEKKNQTQTGGGSPIPVEFDFLDDQLRSLVLKVDLTLPPQEKWEVDALKNFNLQSAAEEMPQISTRSNKKNKSTTTKENSKKDASEDVILVSESDEEESSSSKVQCSDKKASLGKNLPINKLRSIMLRRRSHLNAYQELKIKKLNDIIKLKESKLKIEERKNVILGNISECLKELTEEMRRGQ
ncbi:uncharacterized protein LOC122504512 [Leptopilina heterotoma]|uniref:uncharacterized protein LOC122504512 n=1 Tax=Leptopilina heterotoma TaxID=63436 RepID=UPI001CA9E1D8|nr:uncharacterized protein LOC122504512 [Leptopilina heterotoma]